MKKLYLSGFFYFVFTVNAYAYLDPGTGSIILSAIIAGLVTIKTYWKMLIEKLKIFLTKKKRELILLNFIKDLKILFFIKKSKKIIL